MNRVSTYYQSDVENATGASERLIANLGSFSIWNFNSNLYINNWTLGFFAKNIFNEEGIVGLWKEENMGTSPEQNYFGNGAKSVITRPRTIGVNVTYNF